MRMEEFLKEAVANFLESRKNGASIGMYTCKRGNDPGRLSAVTTVAVGAFEGLDHGRIPQS